MLKEPITKKEFLKKLAIGGFLLGTIPNLVFGKVFFNGDNAIFGELTAVRIVATDTDGKLQSLDTATYPSLTELSYVKGVTSGVQSQLNNKIEGNQTITLSGDVTGSGATSITASIPNNTVTFEKMQDLTASRLLGRYSGTNGDPQEIELGTGLSFSAGVLNADQTGAGTATWGGINGDITNQTDLVDYVADRLKRVLKVTLYNPALDTPILINSVSYCRIPFNCTITAWYITETSSTPIAGSIVLDVWKDTSGNYPPTSSDSIAGTEKPTLSTQVMNSDVNLTTWTTSLNEGDYLGIKVDSNAACRRIELQLEVEI